MMTLNQFIRHVETVRQGVRPVRRYRGYPNNTYGTTVPGDVPIDVHPPTGWWWNLLGVAWELAYTGGGGGGIPTVQLYNNSGELLMPIPLGALAAGDTAFVYGVQGAGGPTPYNVDTYYGYILPLPMGGELHDETIRFDANTGAANSHRLMIYYEEYPELIA